MIRVSTRMAARGSNQSKYGEHLERTQRLSTKDSDKRGLRVTAAADHGDSHVGQDSDGGRIHKPAMHKSRPERQCPHGAAHASQRPDWSGNRLHALRAKAHVRAPARTRSRSPISTPHAMKGVSPKRHIKP